MPLLFEICRLLTPPILLKLIGITFRGILGKKSMKIFDLNFRVGISMVFFVYILHLGLILIFPMLFNVTLIGCISFSHGIVMVSF